MCKTDCASYSLTQWQFWQLTLKWLSGACALDKNKLSLSRVFIQSCDSRKIHCLTSKFHVKFPLKNRYHNYRFATRLYIYIYIYISTKLIFQTLYMCIYIYIYIYIHKYYGREKGTQLHFPTSLFRESLHSSGV